jgi:ribosomal protein S18 acetylase RimI-like enzyme
MLNLLEKIHHTEIEYVKLFSQSYESDHIIRFCDKSIPDMYTHNFVLIKNDYGIDKTKEIILTELAERKKQESNFLRVDVCYYKETPIGNCELMLNNEIAKMEDFNILKKYQRMGFGTSVIKHLLNEANQKKVDIVYLITDNEDTAKEMYTKCGFKKAGEKIELFFDLGLFHL